MEKCHVDGKYFIVTCCEGGDKRLLMYKPGKQWSGIKLLPPFNQLWFLPWDLQSYSYMPPQAMSMGEAPILLPSISRSTLFGRASQEYSLISWSLIGAQGGPITSTTPGAELNTFFTGMDYRIRWQSDKRVKIGFYTQMAFIGNDIYPLVDNDYTLQISEGTEGSFVMGNYERFYVAASSCGEADILLSVDVSIPIFEPREPQKKKTVYRLCVKCCSYPVYVSKVKNFVVVNSALNPQLRCLYDLIVDTFLSNSMTPPQLQLMPTPSSSESLPILTYYSYEFRGRGPGVTPVSGAITSLQFVAFTKTNNFTGPPNAFPERSGYVYVPILNNYEYLGVRISNIAFSIDVYYDITLDNRVLPGLQLLGSVCIVAYFWEEVSSLAFAARSLPVEVIVGGKIVGNDHEWIANPQNPPPVTRITNRAQGDQPARPLTIPASFTNVILCARAGVIDQFQQFKLAALSVTSDVFTGFVTYNSVLAEPTP